MNYRVERSMLDNWAFWLRRNRYQGGPRRPHNSIGAVMDLGVPTGPVHYNDEMLDPEEEAQLVNEFMANLRETNQRAHAALTARHAREFSDGRGMRWINSQLPERKIAAAMYGTDPDAARKMLQRHCDDGYQMLCRYKCVA